MIAGKFVCLVVTALLLTEGRCCEEETGNPVLDAVKEAFDDESLELQVMESCLEQTKAMLAAAQSKVLEEVEPVSESCTGDGLPEPNGEYFDIMDSGKREWRLAFRGTAHIDKPVYPAYEKSQAGVNIENACKQIGTTEPCTHHYRNDDALDNWQGIAEVAFVLYNDQDKLRQIVFDATGTTYLNWFQKSKVISSPWTDLLTAPQNYFSLGGWGNYRRFLINSVYSGCENDSGWVIAVDKNGAACNYEKTTAYPLFRFSASDTLENWTRGAVGEADTLAVFLKYQ